MRKDTRKYLFWGLEQDRKAFFEKAQELGIIQFIDRSANKFKELPASVREIAQAIKILREFPVIEQVEGLPKKEAEKLAKEVIAHKSVLDRLLEEERTLQHEIARIEPFGNFSVADVKAIEEKTGKKMQFFCAKMGHFSGELPDNLIYCSNANGLDYFLAINDEPLEMEKLIEMPIEHSLEELRRQLKAVEASIANQHEVLKSFQKYNDYFHKAIIHFINDSQLANAQTFVQLNLDDRFFTVEGWVPETKEGELNSLCEPFQVHFEEISPEKDETYPTYLENSGAARMGEDLVHIYDTPSSTDKDPSFWVLCFFVLFFSMIIGDAGYGLALLATALYIRFKHPKIGKTGKRVLKLFTILSVACIIWGLLINSIFGMSFTPEDKLKKYSLIQYLTEKKIAYYKEHNDKVYQKWVAEYPQIKGVDDPHEISLQGYTLKNGEKTFDLVNSLTSGIMLEIALLIGVIHICLSMLRYIRRTWTFIGWIPFIIGGYLYFPSFLGTISMANYMIGIPLKVATEVGLQLMLIGFGTAIFFGILQNRIYGILEGMTAVQILSDILSYLRIYALGLAGGILGSTINEVAGSLGIVFGTILILIGHVINIVLGIMGGIIHGLRLNFLEWYHYSFEGGGKLFKPLKKIEIE